MGVSTNTSVNIQMLNSYLGGNSSTALYIKVSNASYPDTGSGFYLNINSGAYNLCYLCSKIMSGTFQ